MLKNITLLSCLTINILLASGQNPLEIHFDSNKSQLKPEAKSKLDSLATALQNENDYILIIKGYCDATGGNNINDTLAESRAKAIKDYLSTQHLSSDRMVKNWFGSDFPVASNSNTLGKAKNRRVEIIKLHKKDANVSGFNAAVDTTPGKTFRFNNLNFYDNEARILPESIPTLKTLLQLMKDNAQMRIEIAGHVCCDDNMPLSIARAKFVYDYLIRNGIDETRLKYRGYTHAKPLFADESTEENRKANRRVEFTVF